MAKPIKSVQILKGREADVFVERMLAKERARVTTQERRLARQIDENMKLLLVC